MMESKAVIYAVLAVAIGYLLISVVPNRLTAIQEEPSRSDREEVFGLEEKPSIKGPEPLPPTQRGVWDVAQALGIWIVDLMIALGVYFAVKRRLS